jgi:hypothetical protein
VSYEDGDEEDLNEAECTSAITEADVDQNLKSSKKKAQKEKVTAERQKKPALRPKLLPPEREFPFQSFLPYRWEQSEWSFATTISWDHQGI